MEIISTKFNSCNFQNFNFRPTRYLSKRRTRLDLDGNHRFDPKEEGRGVDGIFYVPNFVTKEEGRALESAARSGGGGGSGGAGEWKDLHKRRLQIHGGTPHPSGMVEQELPAFLQEGAKVSIKWRIGHQKGSWTKDREEKCVVSSCVMGRHARKRSTINSLVLFGE